MSDLLLIIHAFATMVMVGVIWTVQLVHYPLFALVGREGFERYQRAHMHRITLIVGPAMLTEAITTVWLVVLPPDDVDGLLAWIGLALLSVLWLSTATVQGPTHQRLSQGYEDRLVRRLVLSNWVRTVAWSARGVIALLLLAEVG
ncbi:MAG: hypothetical protein AAFX05_04005 [Planctomycetota bacterium]